MFFLAVLEASLVAELCAPRLVARPPAFGELGPCASACSLSAIPRGTNLRWPDPVVRPSAHFWRWAGKPPPLPGTWPNAPNATCPQKTPEGTDHRAVVGFVHGEVDGNIPVPLWVPSQINCVFQWVCCVGRCWIALHRSVVYVSRYSVVLAYGDAHCFWDCQTDVANCVHCAGRVSLQDNILTGCRNDFCSHVLTYRYVGPTCEVCI